MSAYKIQTPGNYPEENIQHSECCYSTFHHRSFRFWKNGIYFTYFKTFL